MVPVILCGELPSKEATEKLMSSCKVTHLKEYTRELLTESIKRVRPVGLLVQASDVVDSALLEAASPALRVVSTLSVGHNHIDVHACSRRAISVGNTPGVLSDSTADVALMLMLMVARRYSEVSAALKGGQTPERFTPTWMLGSDVSGATVGVVGIGRIGCAVKTRVEAFGCKVLEFTRATGMDLQKVSQVDFLVLTCSLTDATRHMVNSAVFKAMKNTAFLINISRGAVVDQDALVEALRNNEIRGAGLDVTTPEPLPVDHPLLSDQRVVVVPHIGSGTIRTRAAMAQIAVSNLIAGVNAQPLMHSVTAV